MPPSNNMGAEVTAPVAPEENQILIDWLSWSLKVTDPLEAISLSGLDSMVFVKSDSGGMGYKSSMRSGNVKVYFDGNENMGCHVSMTGQGCRQYEAYKGTKHCWPQLLVQLMDARATFTRIDIAIDNVDGALDLDKLETCINEKLIRTRFKGGYFYKAFTLLQDDETPQGETIYLGSKTSRFKVRFYDKAAQLGINSHWVRCELQCMAERSIEAVKHILSGAEIGQLAVSALNNYFTPINNDDSNRSRCTTQSWWSLWITTTSKIKLTIQKAIKLVNEVMDHIKKQYSASFAMCRKFLGAVDFHEFVHDLVDTGKEKLTKKHDLIMACSRLETELPF